MRRKSRMILLFAVVHMFLLPGISAEAKTKPKLEVREKTTAVGQKCQLKLNGVSGTKKEVRDWKISGEDAGYFKIMNCIIITGLIFF